VGWFVGHEGNFPGKDFVPGGVYSNSCDRRIERNSEEGLSRLLCHGGRQRRRGGEQERGTQAEAYVSWGRVDACLRRASATGEGSTQVVATAADSAVKVRRGLRLFRWHGPDAENMMLDMQKAHTYNPANVCLTDLLAGWCDSAAV
jgi:hypothetical protein